MAEDMIAIVPETADSTARANTTAAGKQENMISVWQSCIAWQYSYITPTVANSN